MSFETSYCSPLDGSLCTAFILANAEIIPNCTLKLMLGVTLNRKKWRYGTRWERHFVYLIVEIVVYFFKQEHTLIFEFFMSGYAT